MQTDAVPYVMASSQICRISSHVAVCASSVWSTCLSISFASIFFPALFLSIFLYSVSYSVFHQYFLKIPEKN